MVAATLACCLVGCGLKLKAPEVVFVVHDDGIVFADVGIRANWKGGETILIVKNASSTKRQLVLARMTGLGSLPPAALAAALSKDQQRVVVMTQMIEPGDPTDPDVDGPGSARFHIYVPPDQRYVLFDRPDGIEKGVALEFSLGEAGSETSGRAAP